MKRYNALILAAVLALPALAVLLPARELAAQSGQVITPSANYNDAAWKGIAGESQADLAALQQTIEKTFSREQLVFVNASESAGGLGFWPNPTGDPGKRYLCIFVKEVVPPPSTGRPFADDQGGRLLTVWDAYAKAMMGPLSKTIEKINNPALVGGAIIMVYSKKPLSDPGYYETGEGVAIFMTRQNVSLYSQYRMTNQALFSQSEVFGIMQGKDQIAMLMSVLRP